MDSALAFVAVAAVSQVAFEALKLAGSIVLVGLGVRLAFEHRD